MIKNRVSLFPTLAQALAAVAFIPFLWRPFQNCVRFFVGVTLWAVCLCPHVTPSVSTSDILLLRDGFQMPRIDTASNATEVIYLEILGNRPNQTFVHQTVCVPERSISTSDLYQSVTLIAQQSRPQPTSTVRLWYAKTMQTFDQGIGRKMHSLHYSGVRNG